MWATEDLENRLEYRRCRSILQELRQGKRKKGDRLYSSLEDVKNKITTTVLWNRIDLKQLWNALIEGDANRPSLPPHIVQIIFDIAECSCCVKKAFLGQGLAVSNMDLMFLKFGPVPGKIKKIEFYCQSHDLGCYCLTDGAQRNLLTGADVEVIDAHGNSRGGKQEVFSNRHGPRGLEAFTRIYVSGDGPLLESQPGDTIVFYFRVTFPTCLLHVVNPTVTMYYEPIIKETNVQPVRVHANWASKLWSILRLNKRMLKMWTFK